LILETPYYDLPSVAARFLPIYPTRWLMNYEFPLHQYLQQVRVPVLTIHGTMDEVISIHHADKLRSLLKPRDRMILVTGGKHNGLSKDPAVRAALDSIWNQ
jgi:pimeloyl-ACP methyl ester carboxylesterase